MQTKNSSRTFGKPGTSASLAYKHAQHRWKNLSFKTQIFVVVAAAVAGAVVSVSSGFQARNGAFVASVISACFIALMQAPRALAMGLMILGYSVIAVPLGYGYTTLAGSPDSVGGMFALVIAALFAALILARHSRGSAVLSLALAMGATIIPGFLLAVAFPSFGLHWARLMLLIVVAARCGGWAWLAGTTGLLLDKWKLRNESELSNSSLVNVATEDVKDPVSAWQLRAEAERKTAELLKDLGSDYTVIHDVVIPKMPHTLSHLTLGPGGMSLIASVASSSPLTIDPFGVRLADIPLDTVVETLIDQRKALAPILKRPIGDFQLVIAIHGTFIQNHVRRFEVLDGNTVIAQASLVDEQGLIPVVDNGLPLFSKVAVAQVSRQAQRKLAGLRPESTVKISGKKLQEMRRRLNLKAINDDGRSPELISRSEFSSQLIPGLKVTILTETGMMSGLRVASAPSLDTVNNRWTVALCAESDWLESKASGTKPFSTPYPVDIVYPDASN